MSGAVCPRCQTEVDPGAMACEDCGHMFVTLSSDAVGHKVGNLEIVSKIASGGMGTVWRAEHQSLRTPYAVKVLHARFSTDATVAERFRREAIALSQLRHPNVVFVTDFGFHESLGIYLIMEFVEGVSLAKLLRKMGGALPLNRGVRIAEQIAEAIQAAHELGIVHRDLKPDNVMILLEGRRRDHAKVLDFGIAQVQQGEDTEKLTRAGLVLGTPAYISPEQINNEAAEVGPACDVYALGAMLYEVLSGRPPFNEGSDFEILSQHVFKAPEPVGRHREDLSGTALETLVADMLLKRPADRPQTMDLVAERLRSAIMELSDAGIADAAYAGRVTSEMMAVQGQRDTGQFGTLTPPPLRITNVIKSIQAATPGSAAAKLLGAFPGVAALQEDIFHLAMWGVLQRELLDWPLDSAEFKAAIQQLTLLTEAALAAGTTQRENFRVDRVMSCLRDTFRLVDEPRQREMVLALQSVLSHHLFPPDVLPEWAGAQSKSTDSGSGWQAFKSIMTMELRLPFGGKDTKVAEGAIGRLAAGPPSTDDDILELEDPATSTWNDAAQPVQTPPPKRAQVQPPRAGGRKWGPGMVFDESGNAAAPRGPATGDPQEGEGGSTLADKLKGEVSVETLKSVFNHEFRLFGKKKGKK